MLYDILYYRPQKQTKPHFLPSLIVGRTSLFRICNNLSGINLHLTCLYPTTPSEKSKSVSLQPHRISESFLWSRFKLRHPFVSTTVCLHYFPIFCFFHWKKWISSNHLQSSLHIGLQIRIFLSCGHLSARYAALFVIPFFAIETIQWYSSAQYQDNFELHKRDEGEHSPRFFKAIELVL